MTTLGFTGTQNLLLTSPHLTQLMDALQPLMHFDEYVTGACIGFDTYVGSTLAFLRDDARHRVIVPANEYKVSRWWETPPCLESWRDIVTIEKMPEGSSFRDRNVRVVELSTELFYCAAYPEDDPRSRRSGTWQTVRLARRAGISVGGIVQSEVS